MIGSGVGVDLRARSETWSTGGGEAVGEAERATRRGRAFEVQAVGLGERWGEI